MAKGNILSDSFEQLAELGSSTAKTTAKQVAQTINPVKLAQTAFGSNESNESNESNNSNKSNESNKSNSPELSRKGKDHTPLDFKKLQEKFKDKEKMKVENLRRRLFQIVKREDERSLERKKAAEEEKKRNEEYEEQEKKKKAQQQLQEQPDNNVPSGKAKRGFITRKKTADQQHMENRPSAGKQ